MALDIMFGGTGDDMMSGLAGDDLMSGRAGNDTVDGGAGVYPLDSSRVSVTYKGEVVAILLNLGDSQDDSVLIQTHFS